jgi:hypothetical protein
MQRFGSVKQLREESATHIISSESEATLPHMSSQMKRRNGKVDDPDVCRSIHNKLVVDNSPLSARKHGARPDRVVSGGNGSARLFGAKREVR